MTSTERTDDHHDNMTRSSRHGYRCDETFDGKSRISDFIFRIAQQIYSLTTMHETYEQQGNKQNDAQESHLPAVAAANNTGDIGSASGYCIASYQFWFYRVPIPTHSLTTRHGNIISGHYELNLL